MVDKKVVETRYAHDSWGITICCGRLLRGGVDWKLLYIENQLCKVKVASFAEAWIENILIWKRKFYLWSPPSRRRGLKNIWGSRFCFGTSVASFAEAWIEKILVGELAKILKRRLLRGGVDWKYYMYADYGKYKNVASFAEAWIEKLSMISIILGVASPPSRRRGLKKSMPKYQKSRWSRLLRGGVDWKDYHDILPHITVVASFAEAWIENTMSICFSKFI